MPEPVTPTQTTPSTNAQTGGLSDGLKITAPETTTTPVAAAAPVVEPPKKKFRLHGREFETLEEAQAYADGMTATAPAPAPVTTVETPARKKASEILFEDPEAAIAAIQEETIQRMRNEDAQKTQLKTVWEQFYENNSDLKGFEDEVEIQRQKHFARIEKLPIEEAGKILATEVRARLAKIRGNANPGVELPSKAATVAGSSGATPPVVTTTAPTSTSFIDEFKAMQSKRGKIAK